MHGSLFVNETVMNMRGMIGKSYGCPAVPIAVHKKIIDAIKDGSCYYANYPDNWYLQTSRILNSAFDLLPSAQETIANQNAIESQPEVSSQMQD
jgi:hypothetical protein